VSRSNAAAHGFVVVRRRWRGGVFVVRAAGWLVGRAGDALDEPLGHLRGAALALVPEAAHERAGLRGRVGTYICSPAPPAEPP
jgi:hypothetical protein